MDLTPKEWRDFMRLYWYAKCAQNWGQQQPIIYIAPKPEKQAKNGKR